uniref:Pep3/Vps18 beta-propeller domain-containing protein n=1 Tax=Caenorhabditis japonica TaxID=281687 RepID=A0A8R1E1E4_CAEJA
MTIHLEKQLLPSGLINRSARLIAIDEKSGKLAVVRKSRTADAHDYIEFYNILNNWLAVPELTICPANGSIEHILFIGNGELMSSHANGSVCFVDPHNSERVKRIQVSASSIWSACKHPAATDASKNTVALVSHSSVLYFIDSINKLITSSISLGVERRLFDVCSNGSIVAIGAIDGIILAGNGKVQNTLNLDRTNRRDPTIAWTVLFIQPSVLACGDSRGTVTLWNSLDGSLLQSISCSQSHILTMCLNEGSLHVSGVDPRIVVIRETANKSYEVVNRRNGPTRDVRSLAAYDNSVFAAGEDSDIYVYKGDCQKLLIQHQSNVIVSNDIVASAGENFIDIFWKQREEETSVMMDDIVRQNYEMIHLAKIYSHKKKIITSWVLDPLGEKLAIGTSCETTIYEINATAQKLKEKLKKTSTLSIGPTSVCIAKNSLFIGKSDFEIFRFHLDNPEKDLRLVAAQDECGSIVKMRANESGSHLCILTTRSQVFLINTDSGDSRLVKVDLAIDMVLTTSIFLLSTSQTMCGSRKIFHEVGFNGIVKRSASSNQLRMTVTNSNSTHAEVPVALNAITDRRIIITSYNGNWAIVDVDVGSVSTSSDGMLRGKKMRKNTDLVITGVRTRTNTTDQQKSKLKGKRILADENVPFTTSHLVQLDVQENASSNIAALKIRKFGMQ